MGFYRDGVWQPDATEIASGESSLVNAHPKNRIIELEDENEQLKELLRRIGDFAHDKSTGPAVPDALWEIRSMAYDAI